MKTGKISYIKKKKENGTHSLISWKPILDDIESRFDAYLEQENRVNRRKMADNRIHACLYFIAPTGHA